MSPSFPVVYKSPMSVVSTLVNTIITPLTLLDRPTNEPDSLLVPELAADSLAGCSPSHLFECSIIVAALLVSSLADPPSLPLAVDTL
jgi:hypothetical protein